MLSFLFVIVCGLYEWNRFCADFVIVCLNLYCRWGSNWSCWVPINPFNPTASLRLSQSMPLSTTSLRLSQSMALSTTSLRLSQSMPLSPTSLRLSQSMPLYHQHLCVCLKACLCHQHLCVCLKACLCHQHHMSWSFCVQWHRW